jgi:hypothetical protein
VKGDEPGFFRFFRLFRNEKFQMSDYLEIARRVLRERRRTPETELAESLEAVLQGKAVELYLSDGNRLFIVADEDDASRLGEPRGAVYTAAEVRRVVQIEDPATVREIHEWKRIFNGRLREGGCK